ncbi:MAG: tRNA lysidine(34) synthetase TilS [Bacteroidota bacterium]|nr:tRNA lysidine(34) synthetase TilS [Bacteroidota bacterium]
MTRTSSNMQSSPLLRLVKQTMQSLGIQPNERILLGVSGGMDSMVMASVLKNLGYSISVAHVNFQLRGDDSNLDNQLIKEWCSQQSISFFELRLDTKEFASDHKLNIQSAARKIRQEWWMDLAKSHSFKFVATAHHHDDAIETFLINALRGSGLKGQQGISSVTIFNSGLKFIRPMLEITRAEIENFAKEYEIPFRHDKSNFKDDYRRNQLRNHIIPALKEMTGQDDSFLKHMLLRSRMEWQVWEIGYNSWQQDHLRRDLSGTFILSQEKNIPYLLRWLEDQGIPWSLSYDYIRSVHPEKGNQLFYGENVLSRTKEGFYLTITSTFHPIEIPNEGEYHLTEDSLSIEKISSEQAIMNSNPNEECTNLKVVQWPLTIRAISEGDVFQPFGMGGKSKKLQDFLVDLKLDAHEKKRVRLLCNADHIIWVMGYRLDERAKVEGNVKEVFALKYIGQQGN